jgi:hypothetical protein
VAFQPFGYAFEVESPSPPSQVKAAIRARKKGWLDAKDGPRGWIIGSFICLWFSAFDRHGPMLFGRISENGLGARVRGRAGSDLNGVIMFSVYLTLMAVAVFGMASGGTASAGQFLVFALLFLVGGGFIYWSAHKDRREAEPLVRFLRDAISVSGRTLRAKTAAVAVAGGLTLNLDGEDQDGPVTPDAIHDALLGAGAGGFIILERSPTSYMQTAIRDGGYILEMRDGDLDRHFQAVRRSVVPPVAENPNIFGFEEAREAFMAFACDALVPHFIVWEHLPLANRGRWRQ